MSEVPKSNEENSNAAESSSSKVANNEPSVAQASSSKVANNDPSLAQASASNASQSAPSLKPFTTKDAEMFIQKIFSDLEPLNEESSNASESSSSKVANNEPSLAQASSSKVANNDPSVAQASASKAPSFKPFTSEDAEMFIQKVFADLDLQNIAFILGRRINRRSRWTKIVQSFRKRMFVFYFSFQVMYELAIDEFFSEVPFCRRNVFALLSSHCFEIIDRSPNIYIAFIYTCSFVYATAMFFKFRDKPEFEEFAPLSANEIYEYKIKKKLEARGGLEALRSYMEANNVAEMVDFLRLMYTNKDLGTTTISLFPGENKFGVSGRTCHEELVIRLELIVDFTQKLFPVEMTFNSVSRERILWAFAKLEREVIIYKGLDERRLTWLKAKREADDMKEVELYKELEKQLQLKDGQPPPHPRQKAESGKKK